MEGLSHLQQFTGNNAEIIPGQIVDPNMKDEVQIILIITGIASTPLKSETVDKSGAEIGTVSTASRVYAEPVRYAVETAPEPEPEMEMAYAVAEPAAANASASSSDRLIPSEPAEVSGYTPSDAANAMFDTIMQPFGLSGIESSSRKVGEKRNGMDSVDYDTPTFLRRRL